MRLLIQRKNNRQFFNFTYLFGIVDFRHQGLWLLVFGKKKKKNSQEFSRDQGQTLVKKTDVTVVDRCVLTLRKGTKHGCGVDFNSW